MIIMIHTIFRELFISWRSGSVSEVRGGYTQKFEVLNRRGGCSHNYLLCRIRVKQCLHNIIIEVCWEVTVKLCAQVNINGKRKFLEESCHRKVMCTS